MSVARVRPEWRAPEDEPVLAWNLRQTDPDLHDRFKEAATVRANLLFLIFTDREKPPREVQTKTTFSAAGGEGKFWSNFYAAVREARLDLADAGQIDLGEDEENYPPLVVRLYA